MRTPAVVIALVLLILDGLVRETHPGMIDAAVAILQRAPAVSPEAMSAALSG